MVKIIFRNQPKLSEHAVDQAFNERRQALVPFVEEYITNQDIFKNKEVGVTFSHHGVSSLISIIDGGEKKMVLKIPLSLSVSEGEAIFLKVWEKAGVSVPHIVDDGYINGHPYIFYEYVDAPLLGDVYDHEAKIKNGIYLEMGQTLRMMHEPRAEGYGMVVKGKAEHSTFEGWLNEPHMRERIDYVKEHKLLGEEHGSLEEALQVLTEHVNKEDKSSYCHFDFGGNIFATKPITVFDPNPGFHNGYLDLGRTIVNHLAVGIFPAQIVEGYFGGKVYNKKALQAAVLLNAYFKLPHQHKRNKSEIIKNIQDYLVKSNLVVN